MEISKPLGGHVLFGFSWFFFSSPRRPIHISLVACKMWILNSLALVMHFLNFKNPSLQKLVFLLRVLFPFVCFQTTQQLLQNLMTSGCAFHKAVSKKSLRSTWTSIEAIQQNSSFSSTFLMAQPEGQERDNITGLCMLMLSLPGI